MNIKSKKLKTAVLVSILTLGITTNAFADKIGEGAYSWDRDWSIMLGQGNQTGGSSSSTYTYLQYNASTGLLSYYSRTYDPEDGNSSKTIVLGDAKTILGGMSEEDILDIVDDAIHNVQGDQTVNGSQDITGDQTVEGEQTVNGGQTVTGGLLFFYNKV